MFCEADAFLNVIFDNPDDDTPRLVYADWLEEHGEPEYAQFIRVDCEIARREVMPPAERKALRDRRFCLWGAIEARWAERLTGLAISYHGFSRGILHAQPCVDAATFVSRSHHWWPLLPIRDLTIYEPDGHEAAIASCLYLSRLRSLEIGDTGWHDPWAPVPLIGEAMLSEIARSPLLNQLEALAIGPVCPSSATLEAFAAAPFMERLPGDAFRLRLGRSAIRMGDDDIIRGHPGESARETLLRFLQEAGRELNS